MSFESELRDSLRRKEAPPDFASKVMAELVAPASRRPYRRRPAGAVAAGLLVLAMSTWTVHRYVEQQREGERAKEQLMLALRITSQKLHETQQHLQR